MSECLSKLKLPDPIEYVRCLYIGRHCLHTHIVDVAPIYPTSPPVSHEDLDFFMWSLGIPHYSETYVNLQSSRAMVNYAQMDKDDRPDVNFIVVHYDQDENDGTPFLHFKNKALKNMVGDDHMTWTGDIFVHKVSAVTGAMMDVVPDDLDDIAVILRHALMTGRIV